MNFYDSVIEVIDAEIENIIYMAKQLKNEQVEKAVELLANCEGKIISTGIGKSGIIAQKFAATVKSIGVSSVYIHPCDAMHGDLGLVLEKDIVLVFSYSGETDELINLIPYLRSKGAVIVSLIGNEQSTIARNSDVVIKSPIMYEACPFNLVPTSSTIVMMAIADGLAISIMKHKNIRPDDFALNHPSGRLGKRLTLRVKDLMHKDADNPKVGPGASINEVIKAISDGSLGAVSVVDDNNLLLGIITDGDIRRLLQKNDWTNIMSIISEAIMTKNPIFVFPNTTAYDAMKLMEERKSQISVLPVANEKNECIGMIRLHDIVRSGL